MRRGSLRRIQFLILTLSWGCGGGVLFFSFYMVKRILPPLVALVAGIGVILWIINSPFWQTMVKVSTVMRLVHEQYVDADEVSYDRLGQTAIEGIMAGLDAHSRYMAQADFDRFSESTQQQYVGIGVEIERLRDRVTVITVFDGGAAAQAGIQPGDQIVEVEGEAAREWSVVEISERLRGLPGESVSAAFWRQIPGEERRVELIRAPVQLSSVREVTIDESGFGYLAIRHFGEQTAGEVDRVLEDFEAARLRGLIIDMRDNPGGLLDAAKDVADLLLPPGQLITFIEGRIKEEREEFRAGPGLRLPGVPVVVIINEGSASGAEIVAGALQDANRASVVGATSFGKGSVQSIYSFRTGDALRQTTARYYLPSGRSIDKVGVQPDVEVEFSVQERAELILQRRHSEVLDRATFEEVFGWPPDRTDRPLEAAREILRAQGATKNT